MAEEDTIDFSLEKKSIISLVKGPPRILRIKEISVQKDSFLSYLPAIFSIKQDACKFKISFALLKYVIRQFFYSPPSAVLVAIAIPIFTAQLERSREAVDAANIRAGYAEAMTEMIASGASSGESSSTYTVKQTEKGSWIADDIDWRICNDSAPSMSGITTYKVEVSGNGVASVKKIS